MTLPILVFQIHTFQLIAKGPTDTADTVLLSQGSVTGSFESDPGVNWTDNTTLKMVSFTLTQALADAMSNPSLSEVPGYRCGIHTMTMRGDVNVVPEPAAISLLLSSGAVLLVIALKRVTRAGVLDRSNFTPRQSNFQADGICKMKTGFSVFMFVVVFLEMSTSVSAATTTVHVFDFNFSVNPSGQPIVDPTINLGDTVHWVWDSGVHSTTSVAGLTESWDSGNHSPAFSFDHIFTHLGLFWYYCDIHGSDNGDGTASGMSGTIDVVPGPSTWNGPGGGSFNLASNWANNTVPNSVDATANFLGNITAPSTVTLDSSVTLGNLNFNSSQSYTIAGSSNLILQVSSGTASMNLLTGSHEISVPVVINSDTVISGPGTLDLSGGISGSHTLTVLGNLTATSIQVDALTIGGAGATVVPEPSTFALLGAGAIGGIAYAWRRPRQAR